MSCLIVLFFKQKTAYEMRISDWSSDVCSSDLYAGRGGTPDLDTLDLERVEVLRGPQGTLFGKNAIGGLVQFVSSKPDDETSFYFDGTYGNYSRVGITARGNLPLSDKIFLSAGGAHQKPHGVEYNENTRQYSKTLHTTTEPPTHALVPTDPPHTTPPPAVSPPAQKRT